MLYIPDIASEPDPDDGLISRACMAKYLLGLLAEDFSQTYCLISWADDLEYLFWAAAHGEEVEGAFGPTILSEKERKLILDLATVADGWWVAHPNFGNSDESFLSLKTWRERAAAHGKT